MNYKVCFVQVNIIMNLYGSLKKRLHISLIKVKHKTKPVFNKN